MGDGPEISPTPPARRKDRQAALLEIVETSPDGILVVDRTGRIALYNRRFMEIWGVPEDIARSRSDERALDSVLDKLIDPEGFRARVRHLYEHPDEPSLEDIPLKDGRTLERHSAPLRDEKGAAYGRIWYFRDVTDRLEVQRALERRNVELEVFVAAASHDLRSPLHSIEAFGGLLAQEAGLDGRKRDMIARVRAAAWRAEQLIDGLLCYMNVDETSAAPEDVALDEVLRDLRQELAKWLTESGATIEAAPLPIVRAHRRLVRLLFLNLLANALKFRESGASPHIRVDALRRERFAVVSVRDQGIGFEPDQAQNILRPFHRLHPRDRYAGSGLGLALCVHIAERYGGRLEASGRPNEGAVFTVHLPLSA